MAADKELLKEVALELWNTTKKLRPGLPKAPRAQLVLKALLTIGDMSDQLEAAMVLGVIEAQEPDDEPGQGEAAGEDKTVSETDAKTERETPRVVLSHLRIVEYCRCSLNHLWHKTLFHIYLFLEMHLRILIPFLILLKKRTFVNY